MKQTLLFTLFSFAIATFMTACSGQMADKMAIVGEPALSSDPCTAIDEKVLRLDRFTEVVQNTSAFHLEEKATALPVPGITVSNNRKQMLRDAKKKYAEYAAEHEKYGCETPMNTGTALMADKKTVASKPALSSESCHAIDTKLMKLDEFTTMVNHTSAFHLEEKAAALPVPGITVSNNKKQMLRDAKKKQTELLQERQKYGCKTPITVGTAPIPDEKAVVNKPALSSESSADSEKTMMKPDELTTKVNKTSTLLMDEKVTPLTVPMNTVNHDKEQMVSHAEQKDAQLEVEHQKYTDESPMPTGTAPIPDEKAVVNKPALSSESSADSEKTMMKPDELTTKVNKTSTLLMDEKVTPLTVPVITVNHDKEQMVSDAEKKDAQLEVEQQKYTDESPMPTGTAPLADKKAVASKPALSSDACDAINKKLIKLYEFMIMVNNTSAFHLEEKAAALSVPGITVSNNKKKMIKDAEKKQAELLAEHQKYSCETSTK